MSDGDGSPLKGSVLKTLLSHMLTVVVGATRAKVYSFHSLRVYLACALLATGASAAQGGRVVVDQSGTCALEHAGSVVVGQHWQQLQEPRLLWSGRHGIVICRAPAAFDA